jgi:hypothetical protein
MPIKTNLKDLGIPSREKFKQEITLLSHGYVAPTALPDGKITVFPWEHDTDDWMLEESKKSDRKNILFNLFPRLCNLNGCDPMNFVVGDMNTVLLVSRAINNANVIEYQAVCPYCRATSRAEVKVPDELEKVGEKSAKYPGYDDITLPVSKDTVRIRPLLVRDEVTIQNREVGPGFPQMSDRMAHIIAPIMQVGGGKPDSPKELVDWYTSLHPKDKKFLEDKQDDLYPHLDTKMRLVCGDCGKRYVHNLSFNDEFFR